jgi:hypothetical protein
MGRQIFEVAALLIGVAVITLIVGKADNTAKVIQSAGGVFNDALRVVTMQNGFGFGGYTG